MFLEFSLPESVNTNEEENLKCFGFDFTLVDPVTFSYLHLHHSVYSCAYFCEKWCLEFILRML